MQHLSNEELLALLSAAKASRERDWLMILVGFWHGLRASEVVGLTRANVHDGQLTVARLKGSLKTTQPLVQHEEPLLNEAPALVEYVERMHANQKVFPVSRVQFWRLVQKHAATAGVPAYKAHPHILKHTIAMQSIHSAGVENVRQYLGHKSLSSTGAYLQVDDAQAASAVTRAVGTPDSD